MLGANTSIWRAAMQGGGGGGVPFYQTLFANGETGDFWMPNPSFGKVWQDTAKTIPADAHNDPVRVIEGLVNGIDLVAPADVNRPLLQTDGTSWWLQGDNTNSNMSGAYSQSAYPLTIAGMWGVGGTSGESAMTVYGGTVNVYKGLFQYTTVPNFRAWERNTTLIVVAGPSSGTAPFYACAKFETSQVTMAIDGVDGTPQGNTNAYGTSTDIVLFDSRPTTIQSPSGARFYGGLVRNVLLSASEDTALSNYLHAQQGL